MNEESGVRWVIKKRKELEKDNEFRYSKSQNMKKLIKIHKPQEWEREKVWGSEKTLGSEEACGL